MTPQFVRWNNTVHRLQRSGHPDLEKHLFLGYRYGTDMPHVVPGDRDSPHVWCMGPTGSGKTSRVLAPYSVQRIAGGWSGLLIDPKGDKGWFEACWAECKHQGIPFRWVDVTPGRWSYAFRPFAQSHAEAQTLSARAETIIQALNLDYGAVYGGSYYTAMDELFALACLRLFPDAGTPAELARKFDSPAPFKKLLGEHGWEDSSHVRAIYAKLAESSALNVLAGQPGVTQAVLDAAIDMRSPFYHQEVIYLILDMRTLATTSRAVMGLAFYNLLTAAKYIGPKPPVKVFCALDEAQTGIGPNLATVLETSRSLGIELVLAHQDLSQLRKANQDYRTTLEECCGLQVVFNPTAQMTREWIEATSGEQLYAALNWEQEVRPGFDPRDAAALRPQLAARPGLLDFPRVGVSERPGPGWDRTALMRLSSVPGVAWVRLTRDQGIARDGGQWVPVETLHHVPKWLHEEWTEKTPWPGPNGQTVLVDRVSPYDRGESPPPTARGAATKERLRRSRLGP